MVENNTHEWNPGEPMSKEFALGVIDGIKQFYRRLYYQPQIKPFNTKEGYEASIEELNGLKKIIEFSVRELKGAWNEVNS